MIQSTDTSRTFPEVRRVVTTRTSGYIRLRYAPRRPRSHDGLPIDLRTDRTISVHEVDDR